jgi:hypothetical protein
MKFLLGQKTNRHPTSRDDHIPISWQNKQRGSIVRLHSRDPARFFAIALSIFVALVVYATYVHQ